MIAKGAAEPAPDDDVIVPEPEVGCVAVMRDSTAWRHDEDGWRYVSDLGNAERAISWYEATLDGLPVLGVYVPASRLAEAEATIAALRALHIPANGSPNDGFCDDCCQDWPCRTIRALDGER